MEIYRIEPNMKYPIQAIIKTEDGYITTSGVKIDYSGDVPVLIQVTESHYDQNQYVIDKYDVLVSDVITGDMISDMVNLGFPAIFPIAIQNNDKSLLVYDIAYYIHGNSRTRAVFVGGDVYIIPSAWYDTPNDYRDLDNDITTKVVEDIAENFIAVDTGARLPYNNGVYMSCLRNNVPKHDDEYGYESGRYTGTKFEIAKKYVLYRHIRSKKEFIWHTQLNYTMHVVTERDDAYCNVELGSSNIPYLHEVADKIFALSEDDMKLIATKSGKKWEKFMSSTDVSCHNKEPLLYTPM